MKRILLVTSMAVAALAAAAIVAWPHTSSPTLGLRTATVTASTTRWSMLPPLPGREHIDIDGAATAIFAGHLYVEVVNRNPDPAQPSSVDVFRWTGSAWEGPLGETAVQVNRGSPVDLLVTDKLCLAGTVQTSATLWCLEGARWTQQGPPAFSTTYPQPITGYDGAFVASGHVYILRAHYAGAAIKPGQANVSGTLQHNVLELVGNAWVRSDLDLGAPRGTQRPQGFDWDGKPCIAYDRFGSNANVSPTVSVRCQNGSDWNKVSAAPDLTLATAADSATASKNPHNAIELDGAVVVGGRLLVGVDYFQARNVDWPTLALDSGHWEHETLGTSSAHWDEQGTLYNIAGVPYAVRFDQRSSGHGLRTRIVVRRVVDAHGHSETVGQPLIRNARFLGPLYWGLQHNGTNLYAMTTIPLPSARRNEVRVFQMRMP